MKTTSQNLKYQYQQLTRQLADTAWIAKGNAFRRFLIRKIDGKNKKCGPYFILTRKQNGQTVTHALNQPQFHLYSKAIAHHRQIDAILKKMRKLSVQYIQSTTPKIPTRNRTKKSLS